MPDRVLTTSRDSSFIFKATIFNNDGTNSQVAKTHHHRSREEGRIILSNPPKTYKVTHSVFSGRWNLVLDDPHSEHHPLVVATKPKWYRNSFTLEMGGEVYEFVRPSLMRRNYIVGRVPKDDAADSVTTNNHGKKKKHYELSGTQIGELRAENFFKRTYTIRFDDDIPVELPLFCYWLVSLLNKRSSSSNGTAGGGGGGGGGCGGGGC